MIGGLTIFTADTQLQFLNVAMKLYDQLECIPIYQTFVMLSWIGIGMLVFDEYKLYTKRQLVGLIIAFFVCLLGVKFLTMKNRAQERRERAALQARNSELAA